MSRDHRRTSMMFFTQNLLSNNCKRNISREDLFSSIKYKITLISVLFLQSQLSRNNFSPKYTTGKYKGIFLAYRS